MKILARHKWLAGCTITECNDEAKATNDKAYRKFTATIRGWRNFVIFEGLCFPGMQKEISDKVKEIRNRIDKNDETVFGEDCRISLKPSPPIS